jgi:hypothetical protein
MIKSLFRISVSLGLIGIVLGIAWASGKISR